MPDEIGNHDLYHDRTVQDWHRRELPRMCTAIDLDLMGACKSCSHPLYLIEASTNPEKGVSILRRLARAARVPAFLVLHDTAVITKTYWIEPERADVIQGPAELEATLLALIKGHYGLAHPTYRPLQLFDQEEA